MYHSKHRKGVLSGLSAILCLLTLPLAMPTEALEAGDRLPQVFLTTIDNKSIKTSNLIGTPILINIFATWCIPCRKEMPALARIERKLGRRINVIAIDSESTSIGQVKDFLKTLKDHPKTMTYIGNLEAAQKLHGGNPLPLTLVVDAQGIVVAKFSGYDETGKNPNGFSEKRLIQVIKKL